jgi:predicted AlkP superfamily pyrophosphatase or phosphodiesterase
MRPVLTFFFDALKPSSLQYMPFLNSFTHQRRMRTELGYSVACHPTMYSGVHPNKHLQWFVWKHDPMSSPFGWARAFRYLGFLDSLPTRYFLHKYTRMFREENTAWFGVPLLVNLPLKYWPHFDVTEDRAWDEPGYLKEYPTAFDVLRSHNVDFEVIGMKKGAGDEFAQIGGFSLTEVRPWTYFFLSSVDGYSHKFGQDGPETISRMRELDRLAEVQYDAYSRRVPDFDVFVFSDHGHTMVQRRVDLHGLFSRYGHNLHEFVNVVEANYARFWFRNARERDTVEHILSTIEGGFVLTDEHYRRYHVEMPDSRFGDLVFYLDAPAIFAKTVWGFSRTLNSMHGYLPEHPDSDGVFLSNRPLIEGTHVELVDILPTLLRSLDLPVPDHVDGRVLWADRVVG